jgi:hypothetical protein
MTKSGKFGLCAWLNGISRDYKNLALTSLIMIHCLCVSVSLNTPFITTNDFFENPSGNVEQQKIAEEVLEN